MLGQHLIILNSFDIAHELLDSRGGIYSNRPRLVTFSEMCATPSAPALCMTRLMKLTKFVVQDGMGVHHRPDEPWATLEETSQNNSGEIQSRSSQGICWDAEESGPHFPRGLGQNPGEAQRSYQKAGCTITYFVGRISHHSHRFSERVFSSSRRWLQLNTLSQISGGDDIGNNLWLYR